jgi:hypothetical protein
MSSALQQMTPSPERAATVDPIADTCWRSGSGDEVMIVMSDGGSTPDRCVCCNAPARGYRRRLRVAEQLPNDTDGSDSGLVALLWLVVFVFELFRRKSGVVHLAVCPNCLRRTQRAKWVAGGLALAGVATIVGGGAALGIDAKAHSGLGVTGILVGTTLLFVALAWAVIGTRLLELKHVIGGELWFKPSNRGFVESLPERPDEPEDRPRRRGRKRAKAGSPHRSSGNR